MQYIWLPKQNMFGIEPQYFTTLQLTCSNTFVLTGTDWVNSVASGDAILINISSGNCLFPDGNKPLSEPELLYPSLAMSCGIHLSTNFSRNTQGISHKNMLKKSTSKITATSLRSLFRHLWMVWRWCEPVWSSLDHFELMSTCSAIPGPYWVNVSSFSHPWNIHGQILNFT